MKKITSFTINHDLLTPGIYVSRIDGDVVTYDVRMKVPNGGDYLSSPAMHTIEHIFATFVRNSRHADHVIYFGPMGCRTGFYLLLRDSVTAGEVLDLICEGFAFVRDFEGEIPGNSRIECGNYLEHDLATAKIEAGIMYKIIMNWSPEDMKYKE